MCVIGNLNGARLSRLLHASSEVNGVTQRCVLNQQIGANCTNYDEPGVDANPNVEIDTPALGDLCAVRLDRFQDL